MLLRIGRDETGVYQMPNTIEIDEAYSIPLGRAGKYGQLDVNTSKLPAMVHLYLYEYGLRQVLNDAMATKTDDDGNALTVEEIVAKAQKRLQNLYDGTLRARSAGDAEPADPFEAECYRLAIADLNATFRDAGKFKGLPKGTKDKPMFVINAERAKQGKEEITRADAVAAYLGTKKGADIKKVAAQNLKRRAEDSDDLLASIGM